MSNSKQKGKYKPISEKEFSEWAIRWNKHIEGKKRYEILDIHVGVFSRYIQKKKGRTQKCAIFILEQLSRDDLPPIDLKNSDITYSNLKGQARSILVPNQNWMRSIDLFNAAKNTGFSSQTVDNVLKELVKNNLVYKLPLIIQFDQSRPTKQKNNVFYRLFFHNNTDLMSHEEHLEKHETDFILILQYAILLHIFKSELEKICEMQGINYSNKLSEIKKIASEYWTQNHGEDTHSYKETFGDWDV